MVLRLMRKKKSSISLMHHFMIRTLFNKFLILRISWFVLVVFLAMSCTFNKEEEIFANEICEPENVTFS